MSLKPYHYELSHPRTSIQRCVLGVVGGVCAALLIILFRLAIEGLQSFYLERADDFTTLDPTFRFILPIGGVICIILFAYLTKFRHNRTGIPYVIHRLKTRYGHMPLRPTLNQFFGGAVSLATGFSVGREGPSVHLGAAGSSFFGEWFRLPHNSIRLLAGCGVAAGISASFNTPFAAVIFVMEVVLREYKVHMFIPIMLAAACGSILTRLVFGEDHEMAYLQFISLDYWMYLYLILLGFILGAAGSLFNFQLMRMIRSFSHYKMLTRLLIAGLATGIVGILIPQAMGSGLSAIEMVNHAPDGVHILVAILAGKFVLTIVALGLGVPGGIVGPTFGIGVLIGAIVLLPLSIVVNDVTVFTSSFALLGMAGMMTSVLHAPLAALAAVMELSYNPEVILPAMLVIVASYVTSAQLFKNRSIFTQQLQFQKLPYQSTSVQFTLQNTGVLAVVDKDFKLVNESEQEPLQAHLEKLQDTLLVNTLELDSEHEYALIEWDTSLSRHENEPLKSVKMQGISALCTLAEVYVMLQAERRGAVYVYDRSPHNIVGIITWNNLRNYLHKEDF
ncbi:chloride channel protein [Neptunicella marina]|uniref:Chloride channel protein n=1 Tax=Neptunicella marina TaxID=2125989 RepID=A0A8J6IN99_9ALTE|nr:chloride channel protein [Neptunicella marina]MBC3765160.1 chloride channel protein [Neptunicella marina]